MRLPPDIQRLFYRYHADRLDTATYQSLIIQTVLEDGMVPDWCWLFETYGRGVVADWVAAHGSEVPRVEWFWTCALLGKPHGTPRWSGGNGRQVVPADALPDWWPQEFC